MNFKPIGDRVLIDPDYSKTPTGIFLPVDTKKSSHRRFHGVVKAVPSHEEGDLEVGDTVLFDNYGEEIEWEGKALLLLHPDYILLVMK